MNNLPQLAATNSAAQGHSGAMRPWVSKAKATPIHNRGDGTFEEVPSKRAAHDDIGYYGLGVMGGLRR